MYIFQVVFNHDNEDILGMFSDVDSLLLVDIVTVEYSHL